MKKFITNALALVSVNYVSTTIVDTVITRGGIFYVGTIKSMNNTSIKIATDNGIQKINSKDILKIKFGVKEDYINCKSSSNVIDLRRKIINKQANDTNLNVFLKHDWYGMLISPNNQKTNISVSRSDENIIVTISDKKFIARNIEIDSNDELNFDIIPEGDKKHRMQFKASFSLFKISGNMIDSKGKIGYWTVYKDSVTCSV